MHPETSIAPSQSNSQTAKEVFGGVNKVGGVQLLTKGLTNGTDGGGGGGVGALPWHRYRVWHYPPKGPHDRSRTVLAIVAARVIKRDVPHQ